MTDDCRREKKIRKAFSKRAGEGRELLVKRLSLGTGARENSASCHLSKFAQLCDQCQRMVKWNGSENVLDMQRERGEGARAREKEKRPTLAQHTGADRQKLR